MMSRTKNPQKQNAFSRRKKKSFIMELVARHNAVLPHLAYERSNTFTSNGWPQGPGTWWPRELAETGFYYRGHDLEIHCKLKTSLRDWCHKVNEAPAEAHVRLNRYCEHVVSNGFIPNPNVPEDFQKDDKQAGNSETSTTLTNVGIPVVSKNNSLKTTDTPNAVNGYSCEQRNLTDIGVTDNSSNAVAPEMSDRHQNSIMSPYSTPKDKINSTCIGFKNGYRIEALNNLAKCNTSNQILQKETTDSNNSALPQINTSPRKEPSFDGNVGNGNWSLSQDSILKDNNMSIDVRYRYRKHMINNRAQIDSSNGMNSQLTQDGLQSYQSEFRYPQYQTLTARKSSYDKWQFGHEQSPDVLSKAGYFYTGEKDIVRCFCCDLGLAGWDAKYNAWREHARYNPNCWFLKSQKGESYIKEIQFDWKKIYNPKHTAFDDKQSRVATFGGWRMDIEPDILADAGFFYTGEEDVVRCHYCDGGLRHWEPGDVPWEEHARWFPFCKYIIKMKGRDFIDNIKAAREIDNDEKTHQHLGKKEKLIKKVKQLQSPLLKENQLIELENTELVFPLLKEQHVLKEREGDLQKEDELKEQVKTELLADNILFRRTKIRNAKSKMNFSSVYRGCYLYRKNILARMLVSLEQLIEALDSIKSPHYIWPSGHPLILTKERQIELDFSSNEYLERLYSFVNGINRRHRTWNSDQIVRPEPMVLAGFSYDGEDDKVVCKSCGAISDVNDWSDDDEDYAFTMHRRTGSSHCEFLRKFDPWRSKM